MIEPNIVFNTARSGRGRSLATALAIQGRVKIENCTKYEPLKVAVVQRKNESNEDVRNRIKVIQNNLEYIEKDLSKYVSFDVITQADIKKHCKKHTKIDTFWIEEKLL